VARDHALMAASLQMLLSPSDTSRGAGSEGDGIDTGPLTSNMPCSHPVRLLPALAREGIRGPNPCHRMSRLGRSVEAAPDQFMTEDGNCVSAVSSFSAPLFHSEAVLPAASPGVVRGRTLRSVDE
jgi:hypothetical protein